MAGYIGTQPFTEASYDKQVRIATAGQTTFNVEYSPKFLDVLVNGVELVDADYVAANGSTVVLNEALEESDEVVFKTWGTFNIADTYTKSEVDAKDNLKANIADTYTRAAVDSLISNIDALPDQTGNAGKLLGTNGTTASWQQAGAVDDIFYENAQVITSNYTLAAGRNAMTAGSITINNGVTITISDGSSWTIV